MALGEKLFEGNAKMTMMFVKEIDANGVEMLQSFSEEIIGFGKMPSGMNMGSGKVVMSPNGMAHGKWNGIIMTKDNDTIVWKGTGRSKLKAMDVNGVMTIGFMTMSEKLSWLNSTIAIVEIKGNRMERNSVAYEWL